MLENYAWFVVRLCTGNSEMMSESGKFRVFPKILDIRHVKQLCFLWSTIGQVDCWGWIEPQCTEQETPLSPAWEGVVSCSPLSTAGPKSTPGTIWGNLNVLEKNQECSSIINVDSQIQEIQHELHMLILRIILDQGLV